MEDMPEQFKKASHKSVDKGKVFDPTKNTSNLLRRQENRGEGSNSLDNVKGSSQGEEDISSRKRGRSPESGLGSSNGENALSGDSNQGSPDGSLSPLLRAVGNPELIASYHSGKQKVLEMQNQIIEIQKQLELREFANIMSLMVETFDLYKKGLEDSKTKEQDLSSLYDKNLQLQNELYRKKRAKFIQHANESLQLGEMSSQLIEATFNEGKNREKEIEQDIENIQKQLKHHLELISKSYKKALNIQKKRPGCLFTNEAKEVLQSPAVLQEIAHFMSERAQERAISAGTDLSSVIEVDNEVDNIASNSKSYEFIDMDSTKSYQQNVMKAKRDVYRAKSTKTDNLQNFRNSMNNEQRTAYGEYVKKLSELRSEICDTMSESEKEAFEKMGKGRKRTYICEKAVINNMNDIQKQEYENMNINLQKSYMTSKVEDLRDSIAHQVGWIRSKRTIEEEQ